MAAIATLGVEVKAKGVKETDAELKSLAESADKAEKSTSELSSNSGKLTSSLSSLKGALGAVAIGMAAAFSVGSIRGIVDEWSDLTSRVNLAAGSIDKGTAVMGRLQKMANDTYSSLRTTTEGYIANATTLRGMGKSTKETLDYTEALNNAMVVSGAKAERAAQVQSALAKAMAVGKLSGDNLNTVIQNGGRVAELLAEKLNTTVPGLIAMGTQGKITGDIITESLIGNMEKLAAEAEEMPATIGDAFQRMQNNVLSTIGSFDQLFGSSQTLAGALLFVADNIDRIIVTVGTAVLAFGTYYVGAMAAAAIATGGLTGALALLKTALLTTGVGALVVIVGELIYQLLEAKKATGSWGAAFAALAQRLATLWQGIKYAWYAMVNYMRSVWNGFLADAVSGAQKAVNAITSIFGKTFSGFDSAIADYKESEEDLLEASKTMANGAVEEFKKAFASFSVAESLDLSGDAGASGAIGAAGGGGGNPKKDKSGGGGGKSETEKIAEDMASRLEALKSGLASEQEAKMQSYIKDMETLKWYLDNKKMTEEEYNIWKKRVEDNAFEKSISDQERLVAQHQQELEALKLFYDQKKLTEEEYLRWREYINEQHAEKMQALQFQQYGQALSSLGDMMGAMASMQSSGNEKMLKAQRIFAAASALVSTFEGAAKALSLPFPANIAAAAAVIAKGMSFVAAIRSGSKSSGGGGGVSTSVSAAPAAPAKPQQMAEIKVHGEVFSRDAVIGLVEKINDVQKDGHMINWSYA